MRSHHVIIKTDGGDKMDKAKLYKVIDLTEQITKIDCLLKQMVGQLDDNGKEYRDVLREKVAFLRNKRQDLVNSTEAPTSQPQENVIDLGPAVRRCPMNPKTVAYLSDGWMDFVAVELGRDAESSVDVVGDLAREWTGSQDTRVLLDGTIMTGTHSTLNYEQLLTFVKSVERRFSVDFC